MTTPTQAVPDSDLPTPFPGFDTIVQVAAGLDAFIPENLDSEYTRGIVETAIYGFMDNSVEADLGSDAVREYVMRLGQEITARDAERIASAVKATSTHSGENAMSTPTTVKAPIHFVRVCVEDACNTLFSLRAGSEADALSRLDAAIRESVTAIERIGDAFNPASLVLTAACNSAVSARRDLVNGDTAGALGGVRATVAALNSVPSIIEAHVE